MKFCFHLTYQSRRFFFFFKMSNLCPEIWGIYQTLEKETFDILTQLCRRKSFLDLRDCFQLGKKLKTKTPLLGSTRPHMEHGYQIIVEQAQNMIEYIGCLSNSSNWIIEKVGEQGQIPVILQLKRVKKVVTTLETTSQLYQTLCYFTWRQPTKWVKY